MRFLVQVRDVLIVSLVASFIWFAVDVAVLNAALGDAMKADQIEPIYTVRDVAEQLKRHLRLFTTG